MCKVDEDKDAQIKFMMKKYGVKEYDTANAKNYEKIFRKMDWYERTIKLFLNFEKIKIEKE
ncbi:hypothetical protein I6G82_06550 [Lysinibacillus macroides]|uniref:Uncharacterized protein n=1 Tax=Lysinibacillus macroides TaxID=33935 RepID=A0A0M9DME6_9BACI|nr:hypothetical protein [Lysinibacillus macroides]KOY83396.1 hypothetical protein ADM90_09030 [Lysinibacillus macroides]QPR69267.1 hypothetical protein I6G82_06550 [Lysinibacillus macroides]